MNMQLPMLKFHYNLPFLVLSDSIPPKYFQSTAVFVVEVVYSREKRYFLINAHPILVGVKNSRFFADKAFFYQKLGESGKFRITTQ